MLEKRLRLLSMKLYRHQEIQQIQKYLNNLVPPLLYSYFENPIIFKILSDLFTCQFSIK